MRGFLKILALTLLAAPAAAQDAAIRQTIENQLDAFRTHDTARAFSFASPMIKGIFGTPDNFGAMVEQGYPMVWEPGPAQMLELRTVAGNLWQRVMITDPTGRSYLLDYMMVETAEGWQINAVQLLPDQGVGA